METELEIIHLRKQVASLQSALTELHKNCLYRISEEDDRVTHVPHHIFDTVEKALAIKSFKEIYHGDKG